MPVASRASTGRRYAGQVFTKYEALTGRDASAFLNAFVWPHPIKGPGPAAAITPVPAGIERDQVHDPILESQGNPIVNQNPNSSPGSTATPIQPPPPLPPDQPPSPFVQAFLTNAIFGGGSPAYPFGIGTGVRPGGPGGR
jgi:hypothetical protein